MFPVFCQTMCLKLKCERKLIRSNKLIIILTEYSLKIFDIPKPGSIPGLGRSPGEGNGNPLPVLLPGKIPWTEEPGRLQSMGSQRVRHD